MEEEESWEWSEISLVVAAVTSVVFVFAALYLIQVHKRQWNKMQQMDEGNLLLFFVSWCHWLKICLAYRNGTGHLEINWKAGWGSEYSENNGSVGGRTPDKEADRDQWQFLPVDLSGSVVG